MNNQQLLSALQMMQSEQSCPVQAVCSVNPTMIWILPARSALQIENVTCDLFSFFYLLRDNCRIFSFLDKESVIFKNKYFLWFSESLSLRNINRVLSHLEVVDLLVFNEHLSVSQ